ncbi:Alpha/Beta hydrolase protein [Plectosphaerella plurivora]|uniref:Alpha/Beta hydrolase protein n=1 Tax=Plectosphaerella plurivora TaxID=936078 RepID=A0A9P9AB33_9PEZI|nr:Alpha/Beta hydrolase protein [Plectosphaerella plurivora]
MAFSSTTLTLKDGRSLEYLLSGPADGPVVLLANPLCATLESWDHVVPAIHGKGLRVLRFNQPGHGSSSAPKALDTTFPSIADDVHQLLTYLGLKTVHAWIGVSMGAATSFFFVTRFPGVVDTLIICDTIASSPGNAGQEDLFGPRVAAAREAGSLETTVKQSMQRWFGDDWLAANPDEAERMRTLMGRTTVDGFATCCNALTSDTFDIRPLYRKVGAAVEKALLIVGEKDANLPQTMAVMRDEIEGGFRDAGKQDAVELKVLKDTGHVCYVDGLEQFKGEVLAFL